MKTDKYIEKLTELQACNSAIEWSMKYKDSQQAWDSCARGDWLLWLIGRKCGPPESDSRHKLVLVTCKCARLAWKWMPDEGREAIKTAEDWANKKEGVFLGDVLNAAHAAYAAYDACDADAYAAANAAYAACYAYAAAHAAYAACDDAAYAAYDACDACDDAADAAYAAKIDIQKQCADIIRKYYPNNIIG